MAQTITQLSSSPAGLGTNQFSALSDGNFTKYLGDQGIDINTLTGDQLTAQMTGYTDKGFTFADQSGLGSVDTGTDWGMGGVGGAALGLGQLGLGVASYFEGKKTADAQRDLMGQQYASNQYQLAKDKADSASLSKAFGTA